MRRPEGFSDSPPGPVYGENGPEGTIPAQEAPEPKKTAGDFPVARLKTAPGRPAYT